MVKLAFCLRRLPTLSREEFQKYWRETHAPLVKKHGQTLRIRRYLQLHTMESPVNALLRDSREAPEEYDGIAELWWDSEEDLKAAFDDPAGQKAASELLEDERRFIDLGRSPLWIARENPVIG